MLNDVVHTLQARNVLVGVDDTAILIDFGLACHLGQVRGMPLWATSAEVRCRKLRFRRAGSASRRLSPSSPCQPSLLPAVLPTEVFYLLAAPIRQPQ